MANVGHFSVADARRIARAVRKVEAGEFNADDAQNVPTAPAVFAVRITGAADGDGLYPAVILKLNPTSLTWADYGVCKVFKLDTI